MTKQAPSMTPRQRTKAILDDLSNAKADPATCELIARAVNAIHFLLDEVDRLSPELRTETQSASRWVYLDYMADDLNEAGYDQMAAITAMKAKGVGVPNTKDSLYEACWMPIHKAMYPDTKRLSTKQIQQVYEAFNAFFAQTFGISKPWPDRFNRGQ